MSINGFTRVSNMILKDNDLNIYEKYFIIALKSFDYRNIGEVYPTYETLMKLFGTKNINTIANLIRSLKEKNYIIIMKKNRANCYRFIKDYLAGGANNNDVNANNVVSTSEMSSNVSDTSNSNGGDTTESKLNISSIGSDTRSSNECDTSNSIGSDTIEAKLNTSSIATDTLIKQYKNKKEIYIRIFDKWNEKNIDNYSEIYHNKFYYSYLWNLKNFLVKPNGIYKFIPKGQLYTKLFTCSYLNIKKSQRLSFL